MLREFGLMKNIIWGTQLKLKALEPSYYSCTLIIQKIYSAHISTLLGDQGTNPETLGQALLFHDKCPGFFYVHYTTHRTYSFTSHPKDEAIMVKCLAQGHKRRDRPGRDSWQVHVAIVVKNCLFWLLTKMRTHLGIFDWFLLSFWPPSTIQDNNSQKRLTHFDL